MTTHIKHVLIVVLAGVSVLLLAWKLAAYQEGQNHDQKILAEERLKNDLAVAQVQAQASAANNADLQQKLSASAASTNALRVEVAQLRQALTAQ
jgi:Tfp pilus assembly protein PilO